MNGLAFVQQMPGHSFFTTLLNAKVLLCYIPSVLAVMI
jgi:hypothetical protein